MPKIKTNSGAKKRFALTGTGKIKRKHAFHSHILRSTLFPYTTLFRSKRNLCHMGLVDNANLAQVKELLCMK